MKRQILLALFFTFIYLNLYGQPCNSPFPPATTCSGAPIICSLDGYCTSTGAFNATDIPSTFCGSVQNNQWFAFVAGSTNIQLDFVVGTCQGVPNNQGGIDIGIQAAVYTECGAPWTQITCTPQVFPNTTQSLFLNNLTVGNVYYLMTDGFSGDICDYTINVAAGSTTPPQPGPAGPISGNAQYCPGASSMTYSISTVAGAGFYNWTLPAGASIVGNDMGESITVDFGASAGGQICVTPTNGCLDGAPNCITVTQGPPVTDNVSQNLCPGETYVYGNTTYSTTGTFLNTDLTNADGCVINATVNITVGQEPTTNLVEYICAGDPPIIVGGTPYSTSGYYTNTLLTSLGCDSTVTLDLTVMTPQAAVFPPAAIECGGPNATVTLQAVVTNNSPTISYAWAGPGIVSTSGPTCVVDMPGTYVLVVTQSEGGVSCSTPPFAVNVGDNTAPPVADAGSPQAISCGSSSVTLGGANSSTGANIAYSWTGPNGFSSSDQYPSVSETGQYCFFTFNTSTFCQSTTECVTVTGNNTLPTAVAGADITTIDCNNTTATLSPNGSTAGATYTWSGPNGAESGANPSVSTGGTYILTVDDNGCISTASVNITSDMAAPTAAIAAPSAIDCNNTTVTLDGSGSSGAASYLWSDGATTSTTTANAAGTYTLTITAANGCTDEMSVVVNDNSATITATIDEQGQISCSSNSATLSATNITGTNNPSYIWSTGETTSTISVSSAGTYTLQVTDNSNGCSSSVVSVTVTSNDNPPVAAASSSGDIDCNNPSVVLSTTGSTTGANITEAWTLNGQPVADPSNITSAGTYVLTIEDTSNGCSSTNQVVVSGDTSPPTASIAAPSAIDCNNSAVTLDGSGSSSGVTYLWSDGATTPTTTATTAGTYTLVVTNTTNSCTDEMSVVVNDNSATITATIDEQGQISCSSNSATLSAANITGTNNPSYVWSTGETTSTISVSSAGTYTLQVTDNSNGCSSSVASVTVTSNDNPPVAAASSSGNLDCNNTSVVLSTAGSTTGANISSSWELNGQSVADPNNITASGTYILTITDMGNGCTSTDQVMITQNTTPPVAAIATPLSIDCNNIAVTLDGSGSTGGGAGLTYSWSDGSTAPSLIANAAGTYTLTVIDMANGCFDTEQVTVVDNSTTVAVAATANGQQLTCDNTSVDLEVTSATGANNPTYSWTDPNGNLMSGTGATISATIAGDYTVVVQDPVTGCQGSTTVNLPEDINPPSVSVAPPNDLTCMVSTVTLDGSASSTGNNITYQWMQGGTPVPNGDVAIINVTTAGNYSLVVTNTDNGCSITSASANVVLNDTPPTAVAVAGNNGVISCSASSLTIDGTGSNGNNISYEWSDANGNILGSDPTLDVSSPGTITLTVTNGDNGCTNSTDVVISPDADVPQISVDPFMNIDCANSMATLTGNGSSNTPGATVNVEWQDASGATVSTNSVYQTNTAGDYTFIVTDGGNGCSVSQLVQVTENIQAPTVAVDAPQPLDCNNNMVTVNGSNSSSGTNISYQWQDANGDDLPGEIYATLTTSTAGDYTLVVTDTDNQCTALESVTIISNEEAPVIDATASVIDCNNINSDLQGAITSSFSTDLSYQWVDAVNGGILSTSEMANTPNNGDYNFIVTDNQNGCSSEMLVTVTSNTTPPAVVATASAMELNCIVTETNLDGTGSAANGNYTYSWLLGGVEVSTDLTYTSSVDGVYSLVVTDMDNGCSNTSDNIIITESIAPPLAVAGTSANTLTCINTTTTLEGTGSSIGTEYAYQWFEISTGTPTQVSDELNTTIGVAGTYELVVTNQNNGCTMTSNEVVITQSSDVPVAVIDNDGILTCANSDVMLDGTNSTAGGTISYQWVDANGDVLSTDPNIIVTNPGEITLNIEDMNNGCTSTSTFFVQEDIEEPQIDAGIPATIDCNQPLYTLDGTGSNLDPNITYTYQWTLGADVVGTDLMIPNIGAGGTYVLEITNTENGCVATSEVVVGENFDAPIADAGNGTTITCGQPDAALNGSASSTNGDFAYSWLDQNGVEVFNTINAVTTQAGTYTLVVTNNENGCSTISNTIEIGMDVDLPELILAPIPTITCFNNQEVTLDGSGSESGSDITYQWYLDNAAIPNATSAFLTTTDAGEYTFEVFNAVTGCTNQETFTVGTDLVAPVADGGTGGTLICGQTSFTLDGSANSSIGTNYSYEWYKDGSLVGTGVTIDVGSAGDYTLVVTNTDNNCSATSSIVAIDQDANVPSIDIAPISNITCSQEMVTLDGSGSVANVGNLIYQWTDTLGNILGTTPTIDVNTPGAVTLLITDDANNCSSSQAITVIQDTEPPVANAGVGGTLLCGQTSLTLDGGGSNGNGNPITYNWLDPNGNSIGTAVTVDANGAGLYTLEIENTVNGCTSTSTVLVEQDINVPTALAVFSGMLTCDDEEITVDGSTSTSAGGGILTYQWSNGSTSPMATFTDAGTYSLMVTDGSNNCSATTSFTIDQDISTPTAEIASIGNTLSCTQQSLVFNGANSTPSLGTALTYSWLLNGNEVGSTDEIEVGDDGQLVLVVTNVANGCSSSTDTEITTDESLPVAIIADPDEITCINDEVELNATASSQGTEYQYSWTGPGAIINDTTLTPTMTAAGVYTLTVLNTTNGCEETQNITIDADTNPPAASANATDQLDCVTTEISLTGNGSATGPTVSYLWTTTTGNIVSGATTFTPTISAPGIYSLVVTDASNGCTSTASVNVDASNDTPVVNSYTVNDPNCYGENTGSITLDDVSGGELPYLYSINGSAFAPINQFSFLEAGAYNIIVQDVNGCETPTNIEVINPQELIVELGDDRTIGLGDSILLTPQVVGAYDTLFWKNCVDSNGCDVLDLQVTPLNTTTYSITLLDGNGCSTTDEITINVEKGREVFIPNVFTPNQDGNNDFFIVFGGQEVLKVHEFRVFNRWGEEVFERLDYDPKTYSSDDGWDGFFKGKIMKPGVFVYYVKIEYIDGRKEVLKGDVTLRR